ncbi:CbtA family protein [Agarilytica rhodophyticola]|uniref:CbtA family protein n=1 Tax=Agarilytica rhodophyticola TaxID=1737490 RepID=UPI000B3493B8|nr:CbtA family protein [Agarilytica rhodophyticola]
MLFRRIIVNALLVGIVAGFILSLAQIFIVNPIIFAAETFEISAGHDHASHDHSAQAWAPEDGNERTFYTVISNMFAGIGFATLLLAIMCQLKLQNIIKLGNSRGLLWGVAGFVTFFVAPGLGLPPEIPGVQAAAIEARQLWWLFAVSGVGVGMLVVAFAPMKIKAIGIVLIALPYVVSIPHHSGPTFAHPDPTAVAALTDLHQQFFFASGVSNFLFWLVLGAFCAWTLNRHVLKGFKAND